MIQMKKLELDKRFVFNGRAALLQLNAFRSMNGGITTEAETKNFSRTSFSSVDDNEADKRYSCNDLISVRECEQLVRKSISFRNYSIDLFDSIIIQALSRQVVLEFFK